MRPNAELMLIVLAVLGLPGMAAAQQPPDRSISVAGQGTASAVPDLAVIQAGVTTQGKTAREASAANSAAMTKVLAALKAGGIEERDLLTSSFSIRPVYDSRRDGDNRITGFQTTNQITVRVRVLAKLAPALDQMIAAGANDISGISLTVSDRSTQLDRARSEAVADARRKAEIMAKAAGVGLGPARSIVENDAPPIQTERMTMRPAAAPDVSVPVALGEQTLRVHVSVTFELLH